MSGTQLRRLTIDSLSFLGLGLLAFFSSCGRDPVSHYDRTLPPSSELGSPHGFRIARVITHNHSPYSWDACDSNGMPGGKPNASCLADLRFAACANRIDLMMLSDHPDAMAKYEMPDLLLNQPGDTLLTEAGAPYGNRLGGCETGAKPVIMAGYESSMIMPLGMMKHLDPDVAVRQGLYENQKPEIRERLGKETGALVVVPHTEMWDIDKIEALKPDAIEIYNLHANLDPKIRHRYLGLEPYYVVPDILTYLVDPYKQLNADFSFLSFFTIQPVYFKKWDALIAAGQKVTALGGTDSHENIFSQRASDGERLDSHRRIMRFFSNHVLAHSTDPLELKAALKQGRSWLVIEGLGSPVGMDFYADPGGGITGDTIPLAEGKTTFHVKLPSLHPSSPMGKEPPVIRAELIQVLSDGTEKVVARSSGSDLSYQTGEPAAYRAQLYIIPKQLKPFLHNFESRADKEYIWIVTNPIYLTQ